MGDLLKKKFIYVGSFFIVAILIEFLGFNFMGLGIFPKYFWMDISVIVLLASFIFVIPSFWAEAFFIVGILLIQAILTAVNHSLYVYQGNTIFGFEMLYYAGAAGEAFELKFISIPFIIAMVACVLIEIAVLLFLRRYKVKQNFKLNTIFAVLLIFAVSAFASTFTYAISVDKLKTVSVASEDYRLNDERYLYDNVIQKEKAIKKFGTYVFYFRQLGNIIDESVKGTKSYSAVDEYLSDDSVDYKAVPSVNFGKISGNNVITIMMETGEWYGIDEKLTPNLWAIKNQGVAMGNYHSKDKTNHSEAIGIIGSYPLNCNMLSNLRESGRNEADTYPFALPSVLDREGYNTQYLHSNNGEFYQRKDAMKGYGFTKTYFAEDMPDLRVYGEKKNFYDLSLDSKLFETNLERICNTEDGKPFYSFITTLTMHGDYEDFWNYGDYAYNEISFEEGVKGEPISEKTREERLAKYDVGELRDYYLEIDDFSDTMKNEWGITLQSLKERYGENEAKHWYYRYKRYQAAYMDLDKGIGILLDYLQKNGLLENTTIILYGDHNAYYNDQQYVMKQFKDENGDWQALPVGSVYHTPYYNVAYMIYDGSMPLTVKGADGKTLFDNKGLQTQRLKTQTVERFTCTFDTVPTILDLLGIVYDTRLYHGSSMFSADEVPLTAFISRENGYLTDGLYTIYDSIFYVEDIPYIFKDGEVYVCKDVEQEIAGEKADSQIETRIKKFNSEIVRYLAKQEQLEKIYSSKFFLRTNQYDNADITKFIYKAK